MQGPVVIVPTKYFSTPTERFRQIGVSTVIWANHNVRASIRAMKETSAQIFAQQSLIEVEKQVRELYPCSVCRSVINLVLGGITRLDALLTSPKIIN